jgi:hypothetical protein
MKKAHRFLVPALVFPLMFLSARGLNDTYTVQGDHVVFTVPAAS